MPSLFNRKSKETKAKEAEVRAEAHAAAIKNDADLRPPPPPYSTEADAGPSAKGDAMYDAPPPASDQSVDLDMAFAKLNLTNGSQDLSIDTCLAHLKLLFAFQNMMEDVGYTDGLWNLWNTCADISTPDLEDMDMKNGLEVDPGLNDTKEKRAILSRVREKRWALFVARAVDRYESWWDSLSEGPKLVQADFDNQNSPKYVQFPNIGGKQGVG